MRTLKVAFLSSLICLMNTSFAVASSKNSFLVTGDILTADEIERLCDQRESKVSRNPNDPLSNRICLMNFENAKQYCSNHGGLPSVLDLVELAVQQGSKRISRADRVNEMGWNRLNSIVRPLRTDGSEAKYFINYANSVTPSAGEGRIFSDQRWAPLVWTETLVRDADGKTYLDQPDDQRLPTDFEFARQRISLSQNGDVYLFSMEDGGYVYEHGVHPTAFTEAVRCKGPRK